MVQRVSNVTTQTMLDSQLSGVIPPQFSPYLQPLLNMLIPGGISGMVWNSPGTANSMYLSRIEEKLGKLSEEAASISRNSILYQAAKVGFTTLYSPAGFKPTAEYKTYDDLIQGKIDGLLGSGLQRGAWQLAGQLMNLGDMNTISSGMGQVAYNIAKEGLGRGSYSGFRLGSRIAELFFNSGVSSDGRTAGKAFSSLDWFGFNQGGVATLAGLITDRMDVTSGISGSGPQSVGEGVTRLRRLVKSYAEALAPLQDVFGDDMRSIVDTLEKMSGRSITGIGSTALKTMSADLSARIASGSYDLSGPYGLLSMNSTMHGMLARTSGLSPYAYLSGGAMALGAMDMLGGSGMNAPIYMTESQWKAGARDLAFSSGASTGADMLVKSAVLWMRENKSGKLDDFSRALSGLIGQGADAGTAALRLAGKASLTELDEALGYADYRRFMQTGVGMRLASSVRAMQDVSLGAGAARIDEIFGRHTGAVGASGRARNYRTLMRLAAADPELFSLGEEERNERLRGLDLQGMTAEQASRGIEYISGSSGHMKIGLNTTLLTGTQRIRLRQMQEAKERQAATPLLLETISDSWQKLGENGFSLERLQALNEGNEARLAAIGSLNRDGRLQHVLEAVNMTLGKDRSLGARTRVGRVLSFSMSLGAMTGEFQEAYEQFVSAPSGSDARRYAASRMMLLGGGKTALSDDTYRRLMSMSLYGKDGRKLDGEDLKKARMALVEELAGDPDNALSRVQEKYLESRVRDSKDDSLSKLLGALDEKFAESTKDMADKSGASRIGFFREHLKSNRKDLVSEFGKDQVSLLTDLVNEAKSLDGSKTTELTGIIKLLDDLKPLLEQIARKLPEPKEMSSGNK